MSDDSRTPGKEPLLSTNGIYVIRLRSDSEVKRQELYGRIEHVMSGDDEPFTGLADILDFMARHPECPTTPPRQAASKPRP